MSAPVTEEDRAAARACLKDSFEWEQLTSLAASHAIEAIAKVAADARVAESGANEKLLRERSARAREVRANYQTAGTAGSWQDYAALGAQMEAEKAADEIAARRSR